MRRTPEMPVPSVTRICLRSDRQSAAAAVDLASIAHKSNDQEFSDMNDTTPDKSKDLLESAIKSNTAAWNAQSKYFDKLVKRNIASFASLSDARVASLKEINESLTFNQAFEANIAYEDMVREELKKMNDDNQKAWEELQSELKGIYLPTSNGEEAA
jgi:hypothetical protein